MGRTLDEYSSNENRSEWLNIEMGWGVCAGGPELDFDKLDLT